MSARPKISPAADPIRQPCNHVPLGAKELAAALRVSLNYVYAMRDAGAPFWGRVSTVAAMLEWWAKNPGFTRDMAKNPALDDPRGETGRNGTITVL